VPEVRFSTVWTGNKGKLLYPKLYYYWLILLFAHPAYSAKCITSFNLLTLEKGLFSEIDTIISHNLQVKKLRHRKAK
jgi:hypothetical protein